MRALRASFCLARTPGVLAALMVMTMGGCSGSKSKPVPVAGQVLLEGKPLAQAHVVLVPVGDDVKTDAPRPSAITDEQGRFQLSTFKEKDGAPVGEYAVLVQCFALVKMPGNEVEAGPNILPARFADPQQSPIRVKVEKKSTELTPFEVTRN